MSISHPGFDILPAIGERFDVRALYPVIYLAGENEVVKRKSIIIT